MAESETRRAGGSLSSSEAAMELLSLALEGKDVSLVGPGAAEQGSALRGINPLSAAVGGELGARGCLTSVLSGLADEWGPVAGRESWCLPGPSIPVPGLHPQNRKCLSLRSP